MVRSGSRVFLVGFAMMGLLGCPGLFHELDQEEFQGDADAGEPDVDEPDAGEPEEVGNDTLGDADADSPGEDNPVLSFGLFPESYVILGDNFFVEVRLRDPLGGDWSGELVELSLEEGVFSTGSPEVAAELSEDGDFFRAVFNLTVNEEVETALIATVVEADQVAPVSETLTVDCYRDGFESGEGTVDDPYRICGAGQLARLADYLDDPDVHFQIYRDFSFSEEFAPIGSEDFPFQGFLDGGGHTLSGLVIDDVESDLQGLFGVLGSNGEVRNLVLQDSSVIGNAEVGTLAGRSHGWIDGVTVIGGNVVGSSEVGGLVGESMGEIRNSGVSGVVGSEDTQAHQVGGLVGRSMGMIRDSWVDATVVGYGNVGGLVGEADQVLDSESSGEVIGAEVAGGLVGQLWSFVQDSSSSDHVEGTTVGTGRLLLGRTAVGLGHGRRRRRRVSRRASGGWGRGGQPQHC